MEKLSTYKAATPMLCCVCVDAHSQVVWLSVQLQFHFLSCFHKVSRSDSDICSSCVADSDYISLVCKKQLKSKPSSKCLFSRMSLRRMCFNSSCCGLDYIVYSFLQVVYHFPNNTGCRALCTSQVSPLLQMWHRFFTGQGQNLVSFTVFQ